MTALRPDPVRIAATSSTLVFHAGVLLVCFLPLAPVVFHPPSPDPLVVTFAETPPPAPLPPDPVLPRLPQPQPVMTRPAPAVQTKAIPAPTALPSPEGAGAATPPVSPVGPLNAPVSAVIPAPPGPVTLAYRHAPPPAYPTLARRLKMEGTVVLLVQVDAAGHPVSVDVQTSSGHIELDEAAQRQVREWLFAPAVENGIPHAALARVPVTFRLNP